MAKDISQEEAITIIQKGERARQGRLRAKLNEASRNMDRMYRIKDSGTDGTELAAVCIQKVFSCQRTVMLPVSFFYFCNFCYFQKI